LGRCTELQLFFGRGQHLVALAPSLLEQQRIAARHEPFVGEVSTGDFDEVALVEQRQL
jgi:hypothetical protein